MNKEYKDFKKEVKKIFKNYDWKFYVSRWSDAVDAEGKAKNDQALFERLYIVKSSNPKRKHAYYMFDGDCREGSDAKSLSFGWETANPVCKNFEQEFFELAKLHKKTYDEYDVAIEAASKNLNRLDNIDKKFLKSLG